MARSLLTIVALLLASGALRAEPTSEQIQDWIRDLDSPRFKVRDQAAKSLRDAGADAAPALAKAARNGSAETSDKALRILGEMADSDDAKLEAAGRRHLRRLAESEAAVANDARVLLNRKRNRLLAQLLFAGAAYQEDGDQVTSIDLDNSNDVASAVKVLKYFPELEHLSGSTKRFGDAEAVYLVDLPNLRELNLYRSNIGDEGLKHIAKIKSLRRLPMGETRVTDKGLKIISGMTELEYVGVRHDDVTDAGLAHLKDLTNLTGLYLGETKVTDDGLKLLAPLTKLRELYLHTTGISDSGLEHLREFKDLRHVYLTKTKTTPAGRAKLKEALPDLYIPDVSDD